MVCIRFSASSKTTDCGERNTASETSISVMPNFSAICFSDGRVDVVERRQAVHKECVGLCQRHLFGVDLIRRQKSRMRPPRRSPARHRDPNIRIQHVRVPRALFHASVSVTEPPLCAASSLHRLDQLLCREKAPSARRR